MSGCLEGSMTASPLGRAGTVSFSWVLGHRRSGCPEAAMVDLVVRLREVLVDLAHEDAEGEECCGRGCGGDDEGVERGGPGPHAGGGETCSSGDAAKGRAGQGRVATRSPRAARSASVVRLLVISVGRRCSYRWLVSR